MSPKMRRLFREMQKKRRPARRNNTCPFIGFINAMIIKFSAPQTLVSNG